LQKIPGWGEEEVDLEQIWSEHEQLRNKISILEDGNIVLCDLYNNLQVKFGK